MSMDVLTLLRDHKHLLEDGLMIFEADFTKGRVVFALRDLPINVKFYTGDHQVEIERISDEEVRVKGAGPEPVFLWVTNSIDEAKLLEEIIGLQQKKEVKRERGAIDVQRVFRGYRARKALRELKEQKKLAPKILGTVTISGESAQFHTTALRIDYQYEGGVEGETLIQWERSKSGANQFKPIPHEHHKTYQASLEDIQHDIRVNVTPVREDWVKGPTVTSTNTVTIVLDPKIQEEVDSLLNKRKNHFDVMMKKGEKEVPRLLVIHSSRIEIRKKGALTEDYKLKPHELEEISCKGSRNSFSIKEREKSEVLHFTTESTKTRDIIVVILRTLSARRNSYSKLPNRLSTGSNLTKEIIPEADLSDHDWNILFSNAEEFIYKKDEVILEQGCRNINLYKIKSGIVRIVKESTVVAQLGAGWGIVTARIDC